jgi:hypothetical protein
MTRRILGRSDFFAFFLAWWSGVFAGGFGEIGVSAWCFCGHVVVKRVAKTVCWMACFGGWIFCNFFGFIFVVFYMPASRAGFALSEWLSIQ